MNSLLIVFVLIGLIIGLPLLKLSRRIKEGQRDQAETLLSASLLWPLLVVLSICLFRANVFDTQPAILTLCATILVSMLVLSIPALHNQKKPVRMVLPTCLLIGIVITNAILSHHVQYTNAVPNHSDGNRPSSDAAMRNGNDNYAPQGYQRSFFPESHVQTPPVQTDSAPQQASFTMKFYHQDTPKTDSASLPVKQADSSPSNTLSSNSTPSKVSSGSVRLPTAQPASLPAGGNTGSALISENSPAEKSAIQTLETSNFERRVLERRGPTAPRDLTATTSLEAIPLAGSRADLTNPVGNLREPR